MSKIAFKQNGSRQIHILDYLRHLGVPASVEELSSALGIWPNRIQVSLDSLQKRSLVQVCEQSGGDGEEARRHQLYSISANYKDTVERMILASLAKHASQVKASMPESAEPYMTSSQIIEDLGLIEPSERKAVSRAMARLVKSGKVKIYPAKRRRNILYGDMRLPQITPERLEELQNKLLAPLSPLIKTRPPK